MTPWEWITTTTSVDNMLTTLGLGGLAILFATDRILTKGQHTRRTADLEAHHQRELAEKDSRLAAVDESRREWKQAALTERERADKATEGMATVAGSLARVEHVLESLDRALGGSGGAA